MKKKSKIFLLIIIIALVIITLTILFNGHLRTGEFFLKLASKPELATSISSRISIISFYSILGISVFFICFLSVLFIYFEKASSLTYSFGKYVLYSLRNIFKDSLNYKLLLVIILPLIFIIYYTVKLSPTPDEEYTYIWFVNKPFYNCLIFYPFPNNHVFFSLCAHFFNNLPFSNKLFLIRLPSIIAFGTSAIIVFSFIKNKFSEKISLCVVAIYSTIFMEILFAVQARGYIFICLFFIISFFSAYNIITKKANNKDWIIFIISSILGLYTIPTFLYPYLTINFLILIFKIKEIKKQIGMNIIACITVFILYTPIMLVEGPEALFSNKFVLSIDRLQVLQGLPNFYVSLVQDLFGTYLFIYLIFTIILFISMLYSAYSKEKKLFITFLVCILAPTFLLLLHSVLPYTRVFIYYSFIFAFLIAITWQKQINKLTYKYLFVALIIIQSINLFSSYKSFKDYEIIRNFIGESYEPLFDKETRTFYYVSGDLDFLFEISKRNMNKQIKLDEFAPFISADTVYNYNYTIIEKDRDKTMKTPIFLSNDKMNIYITKH